MFNVHKARSIAHGIFQHREHARQRRNAAALSLLMAGEAPPAELRAAFAHPAARIDEARCLVEREVVDAMIDVSDGLVGDAGHVAAASGVAITLELDRVPVHPAATAALGETEAREVALHGGELVAPQGLRLLQPRVRTSGAVDVPHPTRGGLKKVRAVTAVDGARRLRVGQLAE